MAPPLQTSAPAQELRPAVLAALTNVMREPMHTCRVCAAPVQGFELCWRCSEHQRIAGVADMVAPLVYAVGGTESAAMLSKYKNHPVRTQRERCAAIVADLLRLGIFLHEQCLCAAAGVPVSVRAVIPSLTSRPGVHPLTSIAQSMGLLNDAVLRPGLEACCDRLVRLGKFTVEPGSEVAGRHVLVIDDVWTTGSNAQSAAPTLRRAGAAAVSVMVIGRWLNPRNTLSQKFIRNRLGGAYDPHVCPVTGGTCLSEPPTS